MTTRTPFHAILLCLCVGGFQQATFGQTKAAAKPEPAAAEDAIELSPFVVDASTDVGYQASATLAGSRLKTELKDVAASVSVLTAEMIEDLGATDFAQALALIAGAENDMMTDPTGTNSLNQGYMGGDFGDVNTRSGEVRVRGLGRASTSANYIQTVASPDVYNSERGEFLRGANSILFGLAEPAGMINHSTKTAHLQRNTTRVDSKVDNWGSHREVIDVSRVLVRERLAVRAVGLNSDQRYEVDSAYLRDKRLFLTGSWRPFKHTLVRSYVEHTEKHGRRPNYRTSQDNVTGWLALHNEYAKVLTPAQLAAAFYWDPTVLTATGVPTSSVVAVNGQSIDLGMLRRQMDGNNNATVVFYDSSDWLNPQGNTATIFATRTGTGAIASPANTRSYFVRSASPLENRTGYVDPQITNRAILPYDEVEIGALPGNYRWEKGRKAHVSLEQRLAQNLFVTAAVQREWFRQEQQFSPIAQQQQVSIDINTRLPDGRVNPNFLRPFIYGRNIGDATDHRVDNLILQTSYEFDFGRKAGRFDWLGLHRLGALYTYTENDRHRYQWNWQVDNDIPNVMTAGDGGASRHLYQVWYIGDPVQVGDTGLRLTGFPSTTTAHPNRSYPYTYYDATTRTWKSSPEPLHIGRQVLANGRTYTEQKNDGVGLSWQSYFWKRRIVALFGERKDSVDSFTHALDTQAEPFLGSSRTDYLDTPQSTFKNSKRTSTQSLVLHPTPWLRLLGSRSNNFAATTPRTDSLFRPIAPQHGKTTELGFGVDLFQGRLVLRASRFVSEQKLANSGSANSVASLRIENIEDQIYNALESTGRLGEWWTFGPNGRTSEPYNRPVDIGTTEDSVSKGWEMDVIFNPVSNWRILFNFSHLKNTSTNVGREVGEFLAARADFYRKHFQEGLRVDGTTSANPSSSSLISTNFMNAVAVNYVGAIDREGTSNPGVAKYHAKLLTNYTFRNGWLRGISVGGNLRLEKGKIMGYATKDTVVTVGGLDNVTAAVADPNKPYVHDTILAGGLFASYGRKILGGKVRWKIQLNAQNFFGEHGLRMVAMNPDQSTVWGIAPPRSYELSNSFEF